MFCSGWALGNTMFVECQNILREEKPVICPRAVLSHEATIQTTKADLRTKIKKFWTCQDDVLKWTQQRQSDSTEELQMCRKFFHSNVKSWYEITAKSVFTSKGGFDLLLGFDYLITFFPLMRWLTGRVSCLVCKHYVVLPIVWSRPERYSWKTFHGSQVSYWLISIIIDHVGCDWRLVVPSTGWKRLSW